MEQPTPEKIKEMIYLFYKADINLWRVCQNFQQKIEKRSIKRLLKLKNTSI
jgi:hypothetical protein